MVASEVRQTLRALRRAPWYSVTVIGVVALSLALTTTVFAIVDGTLFTRLPYARPDRLFAVASGYAKVPDRGVDVVYVAAPERFAWPEALPQAAFTAFYASGSATLGVRDSVDAAGVDANFFDVLGTHPMIGGFGPGDFDAIAPVRPALLTYGFWQRRFNADPGIVGRTFIGDGGRGIHVVGVLPPGFVFPLRSVIRPPEVIVPLVVTPVQRQSRSRSLYLLMRLPDGLLARDASAALTAGAARFAAATVLPPAPPTMSERIRLMRGPADTIELRPIRDALTEGVAPFSWLAIGIACGLLLLACANVAGLAIARVRERWRDLAVRRSLGARESDLLRLLVLETACVVGAGLAIGALAAPPLLRVTTRLMPVSLALIKTPAVDPRALVFASAASFVCLLAITLLAARASARTDIRSAIAEGGGTTRSTRGPVLIIAAQVAIALVLATTGALVVDSLLRVFTQDTGFDPGNTAVVTASTPAGTPLGVIDRLLESVRRIPGVAHAGGTNRWILERVITGSDFNPPSGHVDSLDIESIGVTAGYLDAAGLTPVEGRLPTDAEFAAGAPVIVVSRLTAQTYWPGRSAVGQTLETKGRTFAVIGTVADARYVSGDGNMRGAIYWPLAATPRPYLVDVVVRLDPTRPAALSDIVASITRDCPACFLDRAEMLSQALRDTVAPRRFRAWLFSAFGIAGLAIVGVGILGLVAMTTSRRTREIGIRMALGATRGAVVRQILWEQAVAVAAGMAAGGLMAAWAVRFVEAYLYRTPIYDRASWAAAAVVLLVVTIVASLVPSWRASRVNPVQALRAE